jgi:PAS domain-containing protein
MGSSTHWRRGKEVDLKESMGFYSWDLSENKVFADHVFAYIYGLPARDLEVGAPIEEVIKHVAQEDMPRVAKALHETIISGKPCHHTYKISHPGGTKIVVTGHGRCLRNGEGMPAIYTGSVTAEEIGKTPVETDPLASHCLEALKIAKRRRHALAERYLTSALGALGRRGDS